MSSPNTPLIVGAKAKVKLVQDNSQIILDVEKWTVKPNQTKYQDDIQGELRSRPGNILNFYDINLTCKIADTKAIEAMLDRQDNDDGGAVPFESNVGILVTPAGMSAAAFIGANVTIDDWEWASPGRTERNTFTIPMRATEFTKNK